MSTEQQADVNEQRFESPPIGRPEPLTAGSGELAGWDIHTLRASGPARKLARFWSSEAGWGFCTIVALTLPERRSFDRLTREAPR